MAFFKCFKENTITILENDSEDFEEGTTLSVHKVKLVSDVLLLNSPHPTTIEVHDEFRLLGSRVCDEKGKWESCFKVLKESFFTEGYCELVEEVLGRH